MNTVNGFSTVNGVLPEVRQIAQDGVQFSVENYKTQPVLSRANVFAPGNRMDLLVRAPLQETTEPYSFTITDTTNVTPLIILTLNVRGAAIDPPMQFPTADNFPVFPSFLKDLLASDVHIVRTLEFGWESGRTGPGGGAGSAAPEFMIDSRRFAGDRYDQTMVIDDTEEWKLVNSTTTIAHPFHIHVNPFQVIEVYDPTIGALAPPLENFVWQDVIAIPPRGTDKRSRTGMSGSGIASSIFQDRTCSTVTCSRTKIAA